MNYNKFEKNIFDFIKEQQIKIGYRSEAIYLYYPLQSLNRLLDVSCDVQMMKTALLEYAALKEKQLGIIEVSNEGERFCLKFPSKTAEYVHESNTGCEFLCEFIETVSKHGANIEDVYDVFKKHSDCVHIEQIANGEFDYLLFFENGIPDDYRYCIVDEGCHMIYHRFTIDDYNDMFSTDIGN